MIIKGGVHEKKREEGRQSRLKQKRNSKVAELPIKIQGCTSIRNCRTDWNSFILSYSFLVYLLFIDHEYVFEG